MVGKHSLAGKAGLFAGDEDWTIRERIEMKTKTIRVTKKDIANGEPGRTRLCPVALAVKRQWRPVEVQKRAIYVCSDDRRISLPITVGRFIMRFDDGKTVKPFSFKIRI